MSKPHTSALNFEFCLYGMYVHTAYIMAGAADSAGHLNHMLLLLPHVSVVLPHRASVTALERRQQMEREMNAAETRDERAIALHHLCIAPSPTMF